VSRPVWEVADVLRLHGDAFRETYPQTLDQRRVGAALVSCRTAVLGGHVDRCDACGFSDVSYNSCRNRHCPKCQSAARKAWLEDRQEELLPVPYFHVVFTMPEALAKLALFNKRVVYEILFRAAARTLLEIARDPKRLGARIGFLAVLHTWGQNLFHHPHLHCVVPGGGLSEDGQTWIACRKGFFLPVRVLSRRFRTLFLKELAAAYVGGELALPGDLSSLAEPAAFDHLVASQRKLEWVVYSKEPFGGPSHVLAYLGRYTHRVAISNDRILGVEGGRVSFRYKDYRDGNADKVMTLDAREFLRRFFLHVLPGGFVRIRHFGLFANRTRRQSLSRCRSLLDPDGCPSSVVTAEAPVSAIQRDAAYPPDSGDVERHEAKRCPACSSGRLQRFEIPRLAAIARSRVSYRAHAPPVASPVGASSR
jgi:predicted Zn-ribbon and HTH transcriptional regulator